VVDRTEGVQADDLDRRFAAGDDGALRAAYDAHGGLVFNLCRRVVGPDHAPDVAQEVWVAAWNSRHRFDPGRGALMGWLAGIARFKIADHLRRMGRRDVLGVTGDAGETVGDGPAGRMVEPDADRVAERLLVAEALRVLEPRQRAVVELAFYSDATHHEIAERTGLPLGTVKSDIRRGLAKLRRHLEGFDAAPRS
jgi:RNA polymerase sigma-70 factor (ECF subfamily)